ncbi:hypothetical protein TMatcc_004354 [Talaromyces marneffei ATCC 18224]|uniref:Uncharacterized protein n=1 Tax=Talaromyces marneffei (strain ATCC 18224 / CBS 334.59 / QM 7333) TaxID=441960 RepID=B6Q518_TALMQ|nr:hypothetical protein PMAA_022400 [Talaromyces marneffei ATCC 18224]
MLSKTIIAALLATTVTALPSNIAGDSLTERDPGSLSRTGPVEKHDGQPDWVQNPKLIDHPGKPSTPLKRDPNSLVTFYIPKAPALDAEEESGDIDKRFYIYHRPPPGPEPIGEAIDGVVGKRGIEPDWIQNPKLIDHLGKPPTPLKRDPNSLVTFYIPEVPTPDVD